MKWRLTCVCWWKEISAEVEKDNFQNQDQLQVASAKLQEISDMTVIGDKEYYVSNKKIVIVLKKYTMIVFILKIIFIKVSYINYCIGHLSANI